MADNFTGTLFYALERKARLREAQQAQQQQAMDQLSAGLQRNTATQAQNFAQDEKRASEMGATAAEAGQEAPAFDNPRLAELAQMGATQQLSAMRQAADAKRQAEIAAQLKMAHENDLRTAQEASDKWQREHADATALEIARLNQRGENARAWASMNNRGEDVLAKRFVAQVGVTKAAHAQAEANYRAAMANDARVPSWDMGKAESLAAVADAKKKMEQLESQLSDMSRMGMQLFNFEIPPLEKTTGEGQQQRSVQQPSDTWQNQSYGMSYSGPASSSPTPEQTSDTRPRFQRR